jgi:hypothetical protein
MVPHTCYPSTREAEAGGSRVQGQQDPISQKQNQNQKKKKKPSQIFIWAIFAYMALFDPYPNPEKLVFNPHFQRERPSVIFWPGRKSPVHSDGLTKKTLKK